MTGTFTELIYIGLLLFGVWYARQITLSPFEPRRMWLSIVVGCLVTNAGLGLVFYVYFGKMAWFFRPFLYFLGAGLLVIFINQTGWNLEKVFPTGVHKMAWFQELNQTWLYVVLGCLLAIVPLSISLPADLNLVPLLCYCLTGGPMVLAQDLKWRLQVQSGFLVRELIVNHRAEREKIIHGD